MKKTGIVIMAVVFACALFAGQAFADERKGEKVKPQAEAMKGNGDEFEVRLIFDDNGELADVQPGEGTEKYERIQIDTLRGKNFFSSTTVLYGHGSPGYTVYKTRSGYIIITKPQY
jgi:hypothetical protein